MFQDAGHDVTDVVQEKLAGKEDRSILEATTKEKRILMTFDLDFADIREYPPETHSGIVVFRLQDQRWKILEKPARRLLVENILENLKPGLAIVDETRIRIRRPKEKKKPR